MYPHTPTPPARRPIAHPTGVCVCVRTFLIFLYIFVFFCTFSYNLQYLLYILEYFTNIYLNIFVVLFVAVSSPGCLWPHVPWYHGAIFPWYHGTMVLWYLRQAPLSTLSIVQICQSHQSKAHDKIYNSKGSNPTLKLSRIGL